MATRTYPNGTFTVIDHELLDNVAARLLTSGYGQLLDFLRLWLRATTNQTVEVNWIHFTFTSSGRVMDRKTFNRGRKELIDKGIIDVVNHGLGHYRYSERWRQYKPTQEEAKKLRRHENARNDQIARTRDFRSGQKTDTNKGSPSDYISDTTKERGHRGSDRKLDTTPRDAGVPKADGGQCPENGQQVVTGIPPDLSTTVHNNTTTTKGDDELNSFEGLPYPKHLRPIVNRILNERPSDSLGSAVEQAEREWSQENGRHRDITSANTPEALIDAFARQWPSAPLDSSSREAMIGDIDAVGLEGASEIITDMARQPVGSINYPIGLFRSHVKKRRNGMEH
jgi:hypothetical protein